MRRLNPVGSLFGFILTIFLLVGLGVSLWVNRGLAFNPGPVTAFSKDGVVIQGFKSHSDFEKQCVYCHEPLKTDLATKCIICHPEVNQQVQKGEGVHSRVSNVNNCASCHPEHRGRGFDPTKAAYLLYDHSKTNFSLNWHQENFDTTPMQCEACHINGNVGAVENQICLDCHASHDTNFAQAHTRDYGSNCQGCHDGVDRMQDFDHDQTGYTLESKHAHVTCIGCHTSDNLSNTPNKCKDCHAESKLHQGLFDSTCNLCHTPEGWSPATVDNKPFSHFSTAGFSLERHQVDYGNQIIICTTCHNSNLQTIEIQTCVDCHNMNDQAFMTDHLQQFGSECLVCHDGVDRLSNFDHSNFFPLDGKHAAIQCSDCHVNNVYRGTPEECWLCHEEPDIHTGLFGLECGYCHNTEAWSPASLAQHTFPLNHGLNDINTQLKCDACHGTNYVEYACYNCHDHQQVDITKKHLEEGITEQELPECAKCHPTGTVLEND
jgi:predicted CXXCH cytochrome family protein